jgi:hypothetical protein
MTKRRMRVLARRHQGVINFLGQVAVFVAFVIVGALIISTDLN